MAYFCEKCENSVKLYTMGSYAVDHNESVILLSDLSIIKKMWMINLINLHDCFLSSKEIIKMFLKRTCSDTVVEQEYKYLNYLKKHTIDMQEETKGYEGKISFCPFMWNLYNLSTGRYQTSRLIDRLLQIEYCYNLEEVYNGLIELSKSWEDIRNLFVKYAMRGNKMVYHRIILHTEKIIEKEKQVFNQMGEYINEENR